MKWYMICMEIKGNVALDSRKPVGHYIESGQLMIKNCFADPDEVISMFSDYDKNKYIAVEKYEKRKIALPDWLSLEEYINDAYQFDLFWATYPEIRNVQERIQRGLILIFDNGAGVLACIELLKTKNFKSEFRASLRMQLIKWLKSSNKEYDSPFSPKQWEILLSDRIIDEYKDRILEVTDYEGMGVG